MPKISPRPEVTSHPVYQATMAAQHIAYQLMREVPADRKSDAARLHQACVHLTSYAVYALDPDSRVREESWRGVEDAVHEALERIAPLAGYAADSKDTETFLALLGGVEKAAEEALGKAA
jgi:hypothetical protein